MSNPRYENPNYRYGKCAGNREGMPQDPKLCVEEVWWNGYAGQCTRKRTNGLYCWQHHPDTERAKVQKRQEKFEAERERFRLSTLRNKYHAACAALVAEIAAGCNDPRAKCAELMVDFSEVSNDR